MAIRVLQSKPDTALCHCALRSDVIPVVEKGYSLSKCSVIASEAKQSRATHTTLDCFVASLLAMTE
jgi:hypothetical protein